jgi:segregation and condensation protein B
MELSTKIEGILFYKAAPVKKQMLCEALDVSAEELETALLALAPRLQGGATRLISTDSEVELRTAPEIDPIINELRRDELRRDIGKAGAEALAIVLYRGPIARTEIDRIRGVNSSFILRNLMTRGLVERDQEGRQNRYAATPELLAHLGITKQSELAEYQETMDALDAYEKTETV